jgi:hypothetical protein
MQQTGILVRVICGLSAGNGVILLQSMSGHTKQDRIRNKIIR